MKIIDGEIYVNEKDAVDAMMKEMDAFKEEGASSDISLVTGLTIMAFMSRLFKGEEKDGQIIEL